jgi:D-glycero-alpha-D-manno-heptose-7-phosphate kinase
MRDKHSLAMEAIKVEQEVLKEAVGAQDQVCASYGGFNRINFNTDGAVDVTRILAIPERLAELEANLALYFTGFSRFASEVAQEQLKQTPNKTSELRAMRALVDEAEVIVSDTNRSLNDFGRLLHESWSIKRTLTQRISNPAIDEIYEAGREAGALGGKLLGAGGGGFMIFFVPPERRQHLRDRLKKLLCIPFKFSARGSHVVLYEPEKLYDQSLAHERNAIYGQDEENKRVAGRST